MNILNLLEKNKILEKLLNRFVSLYLSSFISTPGEVEKYVQSDSSVICIHHYVEILNLFDTELQLINTKSFIENKFKKLLNEFKKFKFLSILVLDY